MSTSSTRFSRARLMTTPPGTGSAPPESPVPWPRATNGTPSRAQTRTTACTSAADAGQHDERRRLAQMRQRVALVGQQLHRLAQHAARAPQMRPSSSSEPVVRSGRATCRRWYTLGRVRVRLDYGTDGLEVDLPDARVTVIEPVPRPAVPDPHATLLQAIRAPDRLPAAPRAGASRASGSPSRSATSRAPSRAARCCRRIFEEMPQLRRADVTILIATGTHRVEHRRRARADARARHPEPLPRGQPRQPRRSRRWRASARTTTGVRGVPQPRMAGGRRPHHHRLRRAALLRRLQRRAEDGGARPGRPRAR